MGMREPAVLTRRPHYQDTPVPANVIIDDGIPDFAALDKRQSVKLAMKRLCAMCGTRLRRSIAFIGGGMSLKDGAFSDGPMHPKCARYAAEICPFVSGKHREYREHQKEHPGMDARIVPMKKSETMGILLATDYEIVAGGIFKAIDVKSREMIE